MENKGWSAVDRLCLFVASGFGLGLVAPFAPGTFGSIPGVALAYFMSYMPAWLQIPACTALALAAIPVCGAAERILGIKDDGRITADEWMLFPIAVVGIPLPLLPWWSLLLFFCVVRAIDIIKPPPARGLQSIPGGRGIVVDDFVANLYSLAVNWLLYYFLFCR
ncbi:MAG: phosphatidylglycerophosphatase A [Kiritimatiellae bacterium]|nr:phosphatidylglycerophosphatase A [Kiritimatiellia bacterium]